MSFYKMITQGDILSLFTFYAVLPPYQCILGMTFAELSCYNICAIVKTFSNSTTILRKIRGAPVNVEMLFKTFKSDATCLLYIRIPTI